MDAPNPEDLYPEELLALEGLQLLQQELANEYFHDKKTQLSPAFKALVSIAIGAFVAPYLVSSFLSFFSDLTGVATGTAALVA